MICNPLHSVHSDTLWTELSSRPLLSILSLNALKLYFFLNKKDQVLSTQKTDKSMIFYILIFKF
jgi:hypothetical protein